MPDMEAAPLLKPADRQYKGHLTEPDRWDGFGGDCVHALQTHVIGGLLDREPLENMASDYLKVVAIEEAIYRSAAEGRK